MKKNNIIILILIVFILTLLKQSVYFIKREEELIRKNTEQAEIIKIKEKQLKLMVILAKGEEAPENVAK